MSRFAAKISFVGTNYHGWQVQNNAKTVQGEINRALSMIFREDINVVGCGRTDTGVHASHYILHWDAKPSLSPDKIQYKLNAILPHDIAFHQVLEVNQDFHARFSAESRSYEYYVHFSKDPFLLNRSMELFKPLDLNAMNEAAQDFLGEQDFTSMAKAHGGNHTFICNVTRAEWEATKSGIVFHVSANRFLRNMVRAMVGTLMEVGYHKQDTGFVAEVLKQKNRSAAGESVKACGLYLSNIVYPNLNVQ